MLLLVPSLSYVKTSFVIESINTLFSSPGEYSTFVFEESNSSIVFPASVASSAIYLLICETGGAD